LIALSTVAVIAMCATSTANAATLQLHHRSFSKMSRSQKIHFLRRQIHHDKTMDHFFRHHPSIQTAEARKAVHWLRVNMPIAKRHLARLLAIPTYRRTYSAGGIAHMALWLCIHKNEGAWNANTGNGYYGGLQMTSGWGGVKRPDKLSPSAQMALAENQYRASGYSRSWLGQQWPNTSPPCLGYA
jgi:hypothetical protein